MRPGNCIAAAYRKLQSLQFALNEQLNTNTQPLLSQAAKTEHPPWGNRSDRKRRPRPVCIPFSRTVEKRRFLTKQVRQDAAGFRTAAFFSERERVRKRNTHRPRAALSAGAAAALRQGSQSAVRQPPLASTMASSTASHALSADGLYTAPQSAVKRRPRRSCR